MKKHARVKRFLAKAGPVLLVLGLAGCSDSGDSGDSGFGLDLDFCLPFPCPAGGGGAPLGIATASLPDAPLNFAYSQRIVARGGGGTWSVTAGSLPTGLSLAEVLPGDGRITGTPTEVGTFSFTAQVRSGNSSAQQALSIIVGAGVVLQPSDLCSGPAIGIATFEDANLEAVVRSSLRLGTQELILCGPLSGVTHIDARSDGIKSLVGIQNLTGLTLLNLHDNSITDISAVSGLTGLRDLYLFDNSVTDISAVSGLTGLRDLHLSNNSITDISAVSGLTNLFQLHLDNNSITDISALSGLESRIQLYLSGNPDLSNIQPLLDDKWLGPGYVDLRSTSVSCTDVAALEAKGVTVNSDCP